MAKAKRTTRALTLQQQTVTCPICQAEVPVRRETAHYVLHCQTQLEGMAGLLTKIELNTRPKK